jgi:nucleotide-binding universal stress UspA family protein
VLVPVDGSPQSEDALEHALEQFPDADITALTVIDPVDAGYAAAPGPDATGFPGEWYQQAEEHADTVLSDAEETAESYDHDIETESVTGHPARAIEEYVADHDVDHVVIGSHGRTGVSRVLLGSVAEKVVRRVECPVTVVR